jgi:hypothetical protein
MVTRPNSQGTITANTSTQLQTKTWPQVLKWMKLSIFASWFEFNSSRLYHPSTQPTFWAPTTRHCRYLVVALRGSAYIDSRNFLNSLEKRGRLQGKGTDLEPSVAWWRYGAVTTCDACVDYLSRNVSMHLPWFSPSKITSTGKPPRPRVERMLRGIFLVARPPLLAVMQGGEYAGPKHSVLLMPSVIALQ